MESKDSNLEKIAKTLKRSEMKNIVGGNMQYYYSDTNPRAVSVPGVNCVCMCDGSTSTDGGKTKQTVEGGLVCATYCYC